MCVLVCMSVCILCVRFLLCMSLFGVRVIFVLFLFILFFSVCVSVCDILRVFVCMCVCV